MTRSSWGWLPVLTPLIALGLLVTSLGNLAGSYNWPYAMLIFWAGILLIVVPVFWRLLQKDVTRREVLALVILLGEMLFLVSVLRSPVHDIFFDEFLHWRTADDILQTHHLFNYNTLLPVSSYYPGLEIVTTSLVHLTGLGIFQSGLVLVFFARLMMTGALFLILEKLSGSARTAGLGTAIYMGSSTFVFFDGQFAYESLSLPLAVLILWFILKRQEAQSSGSLREQFAWSLVAILSVITEVVTHHTSSYILAAILMIWTGVGIVQNMRGRKQFVPFRITVILLILIFLWLLTVAQVTVGYLAPHIEGTLTTIISLVLGRGGDRPVLSTAQDTSLLAERIVGLFSVGFLMLGLLRGWLVIRDMFRKKVTWNSLAFSLALVSLSYPLVPILRLNSSTWEISNRMASFVFIAVAYVVGLGLAATEMNRLVSLTRRWLVLPAFGVIICGGIIAGSHPATRLPGPYLVEADARSIDMQGVQTAVWARTFLGADNRMVSDRVQSVLMGSYGRQTMVFRYNDSIDISPIFIKAELGKSELQDIQKAKIHYALIDHRIAGGDPLYGYYYESWEQMVVPSFKLPIQADILQKFDRLPNVSRIYDSGDITIYDIGELSRVP